MLKKIATLTALSAVLISTSAHAQFRKPEDAVKYRKAVFTVMATHFGALGEMAQGRAPYDAKVAAENAALVSALASQPWRAFGEGTDVGDTRALPGVWKDSAKFKAAQDRLITEVAKLDAAVKAGSADALKGAVGAIGGSCKGCHDDFRKN